MEMMLLLAAFQEEESGRGAGIVGALFGGAFFLVWLAVLVLVFVSLWKIFEKAGKPGWAGIVPIYNLIVLLEDRKSTRLNSSHEWISYAVFCLKKKKNKTIKKI